MAGRAVSQSAGRSSGVSPPHEETPPPTEGEGRFRNLQAGEPQTGYQAVPATTATSEKTLAACGVP